MSTILSGLDSTNRLVEAVGAGALVQDVAAPTTIVPIGVSADAQSDGTDANASGSAQTSGDSPSLLASLSGDGLLNGIDVAGLDIASHGDVSGGSNGALPHVAGLETIVQPVLDAVPLAGDSTGGLTNILDVAHVGDVIGGTSGSLPIVGGSGGLTNVLDGAHLGDVIGGSSGSLPIVGGSGGLTNILDVAHLGDGLGGTDGLLTLAGPDGTTQPLIAPVNQAIIDFHHELFGLSQQVGLPDVVHSVIHLGETVGLGFIGDPTGPFGSNNLVTDALNLPGNVVSGNLDGAVQNISSDLTNIINSADNVVTQVLHGSDPTNPIPELIQGVGQSIQSLPLLSVNGGNNAGDGGLLGGVVGDITHSNSGHLVDADVGPQQSGGLPINILSSGDSNTHTASVNAVDVGPSGPHLLDLGLLTGSGVTAPLGGESALPLPAVAEIAGATHGILDLHGAHII